MLIADESLAVWRKGTSVMEENPFPDLRIADFEFLNNLETRQRCSRCGKSRMFYCYTCFIALSSLSSRLPHVKLPYKVHVIKHPGEVCGKSTAVHAAILASEDVTIYTYPDIPEYKDDFRVVLVYPGGNAVTMQDYVRSLNVAKENSGPIAENTDAVSSTENAVDSMEKTDVSSNVLHFSSSTNVANVASDLENSRHKISKTNELEDKEQRLEGDEQELCPEKPPEKQSPGSCREKQLSECNAEQQSDFSYQKQLLGINSNRKENPSSFSGLSLDRSRNLIDVVVFIDSTWFQVHKISSDPRLSGLQRIELTLHDTKFWRHQSDKPSTYLSTIEAMYYCAREYHECCSDVPYDGQYDNLLFFFCFFYQKIKTLASKTGKKLKAYHQERRKKPKTS